MKIIHYYSLLLIRVLRLDALAGRGDEGRGVHVDAGRCVDVYIDGAGKVAVQQFASFVNQTVTQASGTAIDLKERWPELTELIAKVNKQLLTEQDVEQLHSPEEVQRLRENRRRAEEEVMAAQRAQLQAQQSLSPQTLSPQALSPQTLSPQRVL